MTTIKDQLFTEERPLFGVESVCVENCIFEEGESPLKEASDVVMKGGAFRWKYPLWYCKDVKVENTRFEDNARAGVWYTDNITVKDVEVDAQKEFRRCTNITLENVKIPNAAETMWWCSDVTLKDVYAHGDYFGMGCKNVTVDNIELRGNYCFDGCKNITIKNSKLLAKDCVWNCENVTIENCTIEGEYIAWNSKNVTLINCDVQSLQGFCYIDNLKIIDCRLKGTNLAFEYSVVDAEVSDSIDSVMNPKSGRIVAKRIEKLIMDPNEVDLDATVIESEIGERLDKFDGEIPA